MHIRLIFKYYFFGNVAFKINANNPAGINPVVSNSFLFGLPPPPDFLRDLAINPSQSRKPIKIIKLGQTLFSVNFLL